MENFNGGKMVSDSAVSLLHSLLGECASKSAEGSKVNISSCLVGNDTTKRAVSLLLHKVTDLVTAHNVAVSVCGLDCDVTLTVEDGVVSMHFSNVEKDSKVESTPKVDPAIERKRKRDEWVKKHYGDYLNDDFFTEGEIDQDGGVCSVVKDGRYTTTTYYSFCSPNDVWDYHVGLAVAYARAKGEQIPDFI